VLQSHFFLQEKGGKQDHEDHAQLIDRGDPRRISELQSPKVAQPRKARSPLRIG
jgi:hypothetical protein